MPVARLENGTWPHPARLPLGGGWCGHCTAPGHEGELPPQDVLEAFCNLGYASSCSWSPPERLWDAVRFAVSAPRDSSLRPDPSQCSRGLRLASLFSAMFANEITGPSNMAIWNLICREPTWLRQHDDPRIQKMAECFLESYLKKKA